MSDFHPQPSKIKEYLQALKRSEHLGRQVVFETVLPQSPAIGSDSITRFPPDIQQAIMSVSGDVGSKLFAEGDLKNSQIVLDELRAQGKEIIYLYLWKMIL